MKKLTSKQIRNMWITFFQEKGHLILPSSSLVPKNDDSLLWINSGVATLKDYFSGKKTPPKKRLANSQKAIRTNDIENVGVTSRHHTFFEMLGNFSIGDYFKKEAIDFAYELLFEVFNFSKDKIFITYFENDQDTYNFWLKKGIAKEHLIKGNRETNFWDMGQGPCGPDTEIFYDRGIKYDLDNKGISLLKNDEENDRYIEIWNIVFSEFNNDGKNNYKELSQKNIDTGAGLERIVSIFQESPTNYDTDLFLPIIHKIESFTKFTYKTNNYFEKNEKQALINKHFRIIADHIRGASMAIQDGVFPSNSSRGYIIRKLIRRAYRSKIQLQITDQFFLYKLVSSVVQTLDYYSFNVKRIEQIIQKEEKIFSKTLLQGENMLNDYIRNKFEINLELAFKLYETYGFPIELTKEILKERGIILDTSKWNEFLKKHALVSNQQNNQNAMQQQINVIQKIDKLVSKFVGYEYLEIDSEIIFSKEENGLFYTLVKETPFYATSGGQQYDKGKINNVEVVNVFKDKFNNIFHVTKSKVQISDFNKKVHLSVNTKIRKQKMQNHSATHLLVAAMQKVLNIQDVQKGSYNDEFKLRLDFEFPQKLNEKQIYDIEKVMKSYIEKNVKRKYIETTLENAKAKKAIGLVNYEYSKKVRLVEFPTISLEFCGGTHVAKTGELEAFKIVKVESKGSNNQRIEAITSLETVLSFEEKVKKELLTSLKKLILKNQSLDHNYSLHYQNTLKDIEKSLQKAKLDNKKLQKQKKNKINLEDFSLSVKKIQNHEFLFNLNVDKSQIKQIAIQLRNQNPNKNILLASVENQKSLVCIVSLKIDCLQEMKKLFPNVKGGGHKNFAMGTLDTKIII